MLESSDSELVEQLYADLHAAAKRALAGERPDHTLSATALVHEAFVRIAGPRQIAIEERAHFYAAAVQAMRRVLIDYARARSARKRGDGAAKLSLDDPIDLALVHSGSDFLELDDAIERLAARDPRMAEVVRLRFLCGLPVREVAEALAVSERTVKNDWVFARAWLRSRLSEADA